MASRRSFVLLDTFLLTPDRLRIGTRSQLRILISASLRRKDAGTLWCYRTASRREERIATQVGACRLFLERLQGAVSTSNTYIPVLATNHCGTSMVGDVAGISSSAAGHNSG